MHDVVPLRHYGRTTLAVAITGSLAFVGYTLARNPYIHWEVVGQFLADGSVLRGLVVTLELSGITTVLGIVMAVAVAEMRLSESRIMSGLAWLYVFLFRSIPLIVVLIFVGNMGLFVKHISIPLPFTGVYLYSGATQAVFTPFVASWVAMTITASAYMSEIVRGGLLAVNEGQVQAAKALGLNNAKTLRHVVGPQALRVIVPPMGNEIISVLKASALVSVIAGGDLLTATEVLAGATYRTIELMMVATFWYLVVIAAWSLVQHFIEARVVAR
jgi:polar amino acid transport system permease protein